MSSDPPRTWEYLVRQRPNEADLNRLGEEGWELVGVTGETCYLKRPRLGFKERVTLDQRRSYYASRSLPDRDRDEAER